MKFFIQLLNRNDAKRKLFTVLGEIQFDQSSINCEIIIYSRTNTIKQLCEMQLLRRDVLDFIIKRNTQCDKIVKHL